MTFRKYTSVSENIEVEVKPFFMADKSDLVNQKYVFTYFVTIYNRSERPIQLNSRYWHIQDANNEVQIVKGEGVVGKKPWIEPNRSYSYNSFSVLPTFNGFMKGYYEVITDEEQKKYVDIPRFELVSYLQN